MSKTYRKKDKNTLEVTTITNETHITEEGRAELETQLFHLKADKDKMERGFQDRIVVLEAKIEILNGV